MASEALRLEAPVSTESLRNTVARLAREASIELNVQDLVHVEESHAYLSAGSRLYISHLPNQTFSDTLKVCAAVRAAGFEPIPHIPVRLLNSREELEDLICESVGLAVREMLLISGDYSQPVGPFSSVAEVMRSIDLRSLGIERISIGGHPEGHSNVGLGEIRRAEIEKERIARDHGLQTTFVTQFFFESTPFVQWARLLRRAGVSADIRAGLAGPARISTLLRFAMRCGIGPSIRTLGSRPGAYAKLLGEQGPEQLLTQLAGEAVENPRTHQGIHMFCFGGYLRTCRWLHAISSGQFQLDATGELRVLP